jgi:hypothetical protein
MIWLGSMIHTPIYSRLCSSDHAPYPTHLSPTRYQQPVFEQRLFEKSAQSSSAGKYQCGLNAGNHQDGVVDTHSPFGSTGSGRSIFTMPDFIGVLPMEYVPTSTIMSQKPVIHSLEGFGAIGNGVYVWDTREQYQNTTGYSLHCQNETITVIA